MLKHAIVEEEVKEAIEVADPIAKIVSRDESPHRVQSSKKKISEATRITITIRRKRGNFIASKDASKARAKREFPDKFG